MKFKIEVGTDLNEQIGIDYAGPDNMTAIIVASEIPFDYFVFVKKGIVTKVLHIPSAEPDDIPPRDTYDGIICHPDRQPRKTMPKEWCDEAERVTRKAFN